MLETDSAPQEDTTTYDDDLQKLKEESDKPKPSTKVLKELMKSTFEGIYYFQSCYCILYSAGRRKWILEYSPSVSDIIAVFPVLKRSRHVSNL